MVNNNIAFLQYLKEDFAKDFNDYLEDHKNNSISIENKIDVGDQPQQLLRYYNHNKGKNTVYYLTLTGHQASEESCCVLKAEEDYYCISYKS
jgi:hypothetical protein